jgi:hypothetical protein
MMEAIQPSEKSVLTTATRRNIAEDGNIYLKIGLFSKAFNDKRVLG